MPPPSQAQLLHRHGRAATWGNLGLWPAPDYASAAEALARRVGMAAGLARGQRVLSLASGAGDELRLWREAFGAAQATGTERDSGPVPAGPFDAVLCVDAAYHFSPRADFLAQAFERLRPGGRLAFTDLTLSGRAGLGLRTAARLCGLSAADLLPLAQRSRALRAAGFVDVVAEPLEAEVLDGFVAFVAAQRRRLGAEATGPAWRRVAVTAALIPPCRAAGLGYALFAARRP
jgi:SAM-dependent methyltransferase